MSRQLPRVLVLILILAVMLCHNLSIRPWMLDDAFISFRYAENIAGGHGAVFNPGERVEGYTTFFWVLLLAAGKAIGLSVVPLSRILGSLFSLGTVLLLLFADRFSKSLSRTAALLATLFLGTCGIFTPWASSGMEVTLFAFLMLLSLLFHFRIREKENPGKRELILLGACLALLSMTRPEGLLIAALIPADQLLAGMKKKRRDFLYTGLSFAALYVPYYSWRFAYYGYPLPNTFYTKVGSNAEQIVRGLAYFKDFFSPAALLLVIALIPLLTGRWFKSQRNLSIIPVILFLFTTYIILVGGDIMPAFRFFTPLLPLICLMGGIALDSIPGPRKVSSAAAAILLLAAVAYNLYEIRHDWFIHNKIEIDQTAARGREVGLWLRIHARRDAVLATNTAGSIPYYSRLKTIDMLGLNDLHIAHRPIPDLGKGNPGHEKGDGVYVLSRRPDYIHLGSSLGSIRPDHGFRSDEEIFAQSLFHQLYELKIITLSSGKQLNIFQKKRERL
jgi:arabinofuranosyltransferase